MAETSGNLIDSVVQLASKFADVAIGVDPMTTSLFLSGAILVGLAMVVFGYLSLGAVLSFLVSLVPSGGNPPQGRRQRR